MLLKELSIFDSNDNFLPLIGLVTSNFDACNNILLYILFFNPYFESPTIGCPISY